jgi:hypothetical protein
MAISKEVRAKIVEQASDYTYAELAEMHGCSKSSVQRIVSAANSSTAATGDGGSGSDAQQPVTYESDKATEIQPQASTGEGVHEFDVQEDPQLSSFLESIAEEEAGGVEEAADTAAAEAQDLAADALGRSGVAGGGGEDVESLARSLGIKEESRSSNKGKSRSRRASKPKMPAARETALALPAVAEEEGKKQLPLPLARTQLSLYLTSFKRELVESGFVPSQEELEAIVRRVPRMQRQELSEQLDAVKGTLCLEHSVAQVVNGSLMMAGVASQVGPMVGLELGGWGQELSRQRDELAMSAKLMVLEDWDWYSDRCSGRSRMCMFMLQSAMSTHNANQIKQAHRRLSPTGLPASGFPPCHSPLFLPGGCPAVPSPLPGTSIHT